MKNKIMALERAAGKFGGRLTIVTAPAGFGKTTLVREWCRKQSIPIAWLDLTTADRDRAHFRENVSAAFQQDTGFRDFKDADQEGPAALVIDDCHIVGKEAAAQIIRELSVTTPPSLKIVIISRHRLFIREAAIEITAEDLRFTEKQSRDFFEERFSRSLNEETFSGLHSWTRGWSAGMQLVALMVPEYGGVEQWLAQFRGEHHYLVDYFQNEVWKQEPGELRNFMMQTAVAETFDASLCEALADDRGEELLAELMRKQLFLRPMDGEYRYEPLFRAFLQGEIRKISPDKWRRWFVRASEWYADSERGIEAVDCALEAGDDSGAASLIIRFAPDFLEYARRDTAERWTGLLGRIHGEQKARIMLFYCWTYLLRGAVAGLTEFLTDTENQIKECGMPEKYIGELMILRSFTSYLIKDVERAVKQMDEAFVGLAHGHLYFDTDLKLNLSEAQTVRGPLGLKGRIDMASRYLESFKKYRSSLPKTFAGYLYTVGAETAYEMDQMNEARRSAKKALAIAKKRKNVSMLVPAAITFSRILGNEQMFREAFAVIKEAKRFAAGRGRFWELILISQETRLLLGQGRIPEAQRLFYNNVLHADDGPDRLHEFENLTYVRVLIAAEAYDQAELFLEQLLSEAESKDRFGTRIEILVLRGVVYQKTNRIQKGMEVMKEAVFLGEQEGNIRSFLDEKQPIYILLGRLGPDYSPYVEDLLNLFRKALQLSSEGPKLTRREREVLQMMSAGLTNQEIASEMNLTIGTVKGYASTLFRKLDVRNRTHAVARGQELGLPLVQDRNA